LSPAHFVSNIPDVGYIHHQQRCIRLRSDNLKTMKGGMDSFKDQKDELESSLDEIKSSYGDQLKNIAVSVEAQAKGM